MKKMVLALSLFMSSFAFGMEDDERFLMQESRSIDDSEHESEFAELEPDVELIPYGNGHYMTREQFETMADRCDNISTVLMLAFYIVCGVISATL
jgi:hypothetical protein